MKKYTEWMLAQGTSVSSFGERFAAKVPGAVQLDYAKFAGLGDYKYSDNYKQYANLMDYFWQYSTKIPKGEKGKKLFFVSLGIDYRFDITIDGEKVFCQEGMFKKVEIEIPETAVGKELCVIVYPAPRQKTGDASREAANSFKPPVCYGWDFHPRLITQGIWEDTYFETREQSFIEECYITYQLAQDRSYADVKIETTVPDSCGKTIQVNVTSPDGKPVYNVNFEAGQTHKFRVDNPMLWWCHNYGDPNLYTFDIILTDGEKVLDSRAKKIGFRRVKFVAQECNWWLDRFPFTQAYPPITVELNGVQIFAKGCNWVAPEVFVGLITDQTYDTLLEDFKGLNGNFLRLWGGAIVNKEHFFDKCDEMGIMVWQEFQLACMKYDNEDTYIDVARSEATYIIKRLREHPCLSVWCAGNELYVGGSQNTPQFHIIRLLNSLCFTLDKNTPWLDTSPMFGMRHGHYTFRNSDKEECFQSFNIIKATAYTEFGCPAMASYDYIKEVIPEEDLNLEAIREERESWKAHGGVRAWTNDSWIQLGNIEHYFGKSKSLKDIIAKSQILQGVGFKLMYEEARRQKQNCNFALNWCLNEPYPNVANNSLLSYPAVKKPAYYEVQKALKDTVLSARFKKFSWVEGETFPIELWMLNDGIKQVKEGVCEVIVKMEDTEYNLMKWEYGKVEVNKNKQGHTATFVLPKHKCCLFEVILRCEHEEYNNNYKLLYYDKETASMAESMREKPMDFDGIVEETIGMEDVNINV